MCRFESCRPSQTDGCEEGMQDQIPLVVFSGRAHPQLTDRICDYLQIHRGEVRLYNFSDGENGCQIEENVQALTSRAFAADELKQIDDILAAP